MKDLPEIFKNERVSASAGAGKTYALTKRFIALALRERNPQTAIADPTCITALTFTRKSAAEFMSNILKRLADAALDDTSAAKLAADINELSVVEGVGATPFSKDDANALLRACTDNLNRLRLGTIDSFFSSVLKSFPCETGLFSPVEILDVRKSDEIRNRIIDEILAEKSVSKKSFAEFSEMVKRASFGLDQKQFEQSLCDCIRTGRNFWLEIPDESKWGDVLQILGRLPCEWNPNAYQDELKAFSVAVANSENPKIFGTAYAFFDGSDSNTVCTASSVSSQLSDLFRRRALFAGAKVFYRKKGYVLSSALANSARNLLSMLLDGHIARVCAAAKAAAEISKIFESKYDAEIRRAGLMTFDDIPIALASGMSNIGRLAAYRLDARFKHWLFDEFQDTSRLQWRFFGDIMDEVVSYSDGEKTFYYVGDVKQSLYSWRGGDRRLFDEIYNRYNSLAESGESAAVYNGKELVKSWRSGKAVIELVNAVFGNSENLADAFPHGAGENFSAIFTPHVSAEECGDKDKKPSLAQLRLVDEISDDDEKDADAVCEEIFSVIRETNPVARGQTCAVLVNDNASAMKIVDYLRRRIGEEDLKIDVEGEAESPLSFGNMTIPLFAKILKRVAHPSDTAASEYVAMTPLCGFVENFSEKFTSRVREKLASGGFESFVDEYRRAVFAAVPKLNDCGRRNMELLVSACREFDDSDDSGIDAFLSFIGEKTQRLSSLDNGIQVMTIHKSKGLGFGMTILPDLQKIRTHAPDGLQYITESKTENGRKFAVQKTVAYLPPAAICALNDTLSDSLDFNLENEIFENICKLYVALTRSERATYVVMPKPSSAKKSGDKLSIAKLLMYAFEPAFAGTGGDKLLAGSSRISIGDECWYDGFAKPAKDNIVSKLSKIENPKFSETYFERVLPSSFVAGRSQPENSKSQRFGTAVHRAFSKIEFVEGDSEAQARTAVKLAKVDADIAEDVAQKIAATISDSTVRELFIRRNDAKVFNEYSFDSIDGGVAVRGTIDRLVLKMRPDGTFVSAVVADFKSGVFSAASYRPQLSAYADAVSKIFKIEKNKISFKIIEYNNFRAIEI